MKTKSKKRVLCVLQNAWGFGRLPITFVPNPLNKSAKVMKKMLGNDVYYEFGNTTDVVTPTASGHAKPNYAHFKKVISRMGRFDLVLFCGKSGSPDG